MQDMPILKFEKGTKYLNNQLEVQQNNKQLILDIIANVGLILNNAQEEKSHYEKILESANVFLQTISNNITIIQQLNVEITNITSDLTSLLSKQDRNSKSKEFYIASFSNIKNNITQYTEKFHEIGLKLENDNKEFNNFIHENQFKYTFTSNNDEQDSFEFSGFSIDDTIAFPDENLQDSLEVESETEGDIANNTEDNTENDTSSVNIQNNNDVTEVKDEKIQKLTNDFHDFLVTLYKENGNDFNPVNVLANYFNQKAGLNIIIPEDDIKAEEFKTATKEEKISNLADLIEDSVGKDFENYSKNIQEDIPELDEETQNTVLEVNEETNTEDNTSDIVIDYSSLYGNFYKNSNSIEENIFNEYSSFSPDVSLPKTPIKPIYDLENKNELMKLDPIIDEPADDFNISNINLEDELHNSILEDILSSEIELSDLENTVLLEEPKIEETKLETKVESKLDENSIDNQIDKDSKSKSKKEKKTPKKSKEKQSNNSSKLEEAQTEKKTKISNNKNITLKSSSNTSSNYNLSKKVSSIYEASSDNDTLIISEKENKIYLPYTIDEIDRYIKSYPDVYSSATDVVEHEFILPFNSFFEHPVQSRFSETYNLMRNRERTSAVFSVFYATKIANKKNLNPAIIAACKTESELENYLDCLDSNELDKFKSFKIVYDINPLRKY